MKIIKFKLLKWLFVPVVGIGLMIFGGVAWADVEDEICDWSGGYVGCEGESNFKEYKGYYKPPDPDLYEGIFKCFSFRECVLNYTNFFLGFLGLAAIIMIIYGGYLYVLAGGEAEKTEKGKKNVIYAVTGLLIVMISYAVVNTVLLYAPSGETDPGKGAGENQGGGAVPQSNSASSGGAVVTDSNGNTIKVSSQIQSVYKDLQGIYVFYSELQNSINSNIAKIESILNDEEKLTAFVADQNAAQNLINDIRNFYNKMLTKSASFGYLREQIVLANQHLDQLKTQISTIDDQTKKRFMSVVIPAALAQETMFDLIKILILLNTIICDLDADKEDNCTSAGLTPETSADLTAANQSDYNQGVKNQIVFLAQSYVDNFRGLDSGSALYKTFETVIAPPDLLPESDEELKTDFKDKGPSSMTTYGSIGTLIYTDSTDLNNQLFTATAEDLFELDREVLKVTRVNAVLIASKVTGTAPLTVRFDATKSKDPANTAIADDKFVWKNTTVDGVSCTPTDLAPVISCAFQKPGAYTIGVAVNSTDTNILPATVYLNIQVTAPKSKIKLKVNDEVVADYANYDDFSVNKDSFKITLSDAKEGITFDASGTTDAFGISGNVTYFAFDYGDKSTKEEGGEKVRIHKYKEEGQYKFELEVKDKAGNEDAKLLTIDVENIVANIKVSPATGNSLTNFTLDSSGSKSDSAAIVSWQWKVSKYVKVGDSYQFQEIPNLNTSPDINSISDNFLDSANAEIVQISFKNPGIYRIHLNVSDEADPVNSDSVYTDIKVTSQKPVASYIYSFPQPQSNPGYVQFDAVRSYDPDPNDDTLFYNWTVLNGLSVSDYTISNATIVNPTITFLKAGNYQVQLEVKDNHPPQIQQLNTVTQTIDIKNVLGLTMTTKDKNGNETSVFVLSESEGVNQAKVALSVMTTTATYYEVTFGEGDGAATEKEQGDIPNNRIFTLDHVYKTAGIKNISVTVFDAEGNDTVAEKTIKVGDGTKPQGTFIAKINGSKIAESTYNDPPTFAAETYKYYRSSEFLFDPESSVNKDGTNRKLEYSWLLKKVSGNEQCQNASIVYKNFEEKKFSLKFSDLGKYFVKLTVRDKDSSTSDNAYFGCIEIASAPPLMSALEATALASDANLVTPVKVTLRAIGANDPDGKIARYVWWYDEQGKNDRNGAHSTTTPNTEISVNTIGNEGESHTYYFYVELTDNEGASYNLKTEVEQGRRAGVANVIVKNGPNDGPSVKLSVDRTSIMKGESVNFSAEASDPDGESEKIAYIWDLDSDLTYNNSEQEKKCENKSACVALYNAKSSEGIEARVRVKDSGAAESTSTPVKIFVDSTSKEPVASFKFDEPAIGVKEVKLVSSSTIDPANATGSKLIWDKNTAVDSNGDGIKDNDNDPSDSTPREGETFFKYDAFGSYEVKLTVIDGEGNQDEVKRSVTLREEAVSSPRAEFSYKVGEFDTENSKYPVTFNASSSQTTAGATINDYFWDFDSETSASNSEIANDLINLSENIDANTQNDRQQNNITSNFNYVAGTYTVKLTIIDSKNQSNTATKTISLNKPGTLIPKAVFEVSEINVETRSVTFNASKSTSPAGRTIKKYYFDFDTSKESGTASYLMNGKAVNNDGLTNNDVNNDTALDNPVMNTTYANYGSFEVQLTVELDTGERASTVKNVTINDPAANVKPVPHLVSRDSEKENVVNGNIQLTGNEDCVPWDFSATEGSGQFVSFVIDINTKYDLDKDGRPENDADQTFNREGELEICYKREWASQNSIITRLTVLDANSLSAYVERRIEFKEPEQGTIDARMITNPAKQQGGNNANKIVLFGNQGNITFDFSSSVGEGLTYCFDKNKFYDSNGNNVSDDDCTPLTMNQDGKPNPITESFNRDWGKIKAKLFVIDKYGQNDSVEVEIVFQDQGQANIFNIISFDALFSIIAILAFFGILVKSSAFLWQKI